MLSTFESGKSFKFVNQETIQVPFICPVNVKIEKNQYRTVDIDDLGFQSIRNSASYTNLETVVIDPTTIRMHNKIEYNQHLTNKKGLYSSLKNYCSALEKDLFEYVPLTFHIKDGETDPEFSKFLEAYNTQDQEKKKNKGQNI